MGDNSKFCDTGFDPNNPDCSKCEQDVEGCKRYTFEKFGCIPDLKIVDEKPESAENNILQLLIRISNQNEMLLETLNNYIGIVDSRLETLEQSLIKIRKVEE